MGHPRSNTSMSTKLFSVSRFGTKRRERLRSLAPSPEQTGPGAYRLPVGHPCFKDLAVWSSSARGLTE